MKIKQYQVDAFANHVFEGNPAAVCPLDQWLSDETLQAIAEENNLSETAFFVPTADGFHLRWFTPRAEVDLCGHATLASAHVIFEILGHPAATIEFETRSGRLVVERPTGEPTGEMAGELAMDFPAIPPVHCAPPRALIEGLGEMPLEVLAADDYIAVFADEAVIRSIVPDQAALARLDLRGVAITAPGVGVDFVSRFFAPKFGIPEDPVTGSAHCQLAPYWAARLGRHSLRARQVSKRGGDLRCELRDHRLTISGRAVTFMEAVIETGD